MAQPLVIGYHLIWTVYGRWLPNDPRGSGSHTIRKDVIAELGELHFGRRGIQPAGRIIREFYRHAQPVLQHPVVTIDDRLRTEIAAAFSRVMAEQKYTCYACAIMPDHVHILIRKHKHLAEDMIDHLRGFSRLRLSDSSLIPSGHPLWTSGYGWKVFLEHPDEIHRTIAYIERNPIPLGMPIQRWPFIKYYDNWPLHPGHSPNSPYARRLHEAGSYDSSARHV
jgi:REP element-mobilizing transposase RayT